MRDIKTTAQLGFTVVETLVALFLGTILSSGIIAMYINNGNSYVQDEEVARLQENARYAIGMLKRELTMAGFIAGMPDYSDITATGVTGDCVASGNWALDVSAPMELINNVDNTSTLQTINGTTWSCFTNADIVNTTDLISVKRTADRHTIKDGVLNTGITEDLNQWYLRIFNNNETKTWSYVTSSAVISTADKTSGSLIDYWEYYSKIFFVRDHSKDAADGIPTLCLQELVGSSMATNCYAEGVEDMQVEVGIDNDGDAVPDIYKAAPSSTEIAEAATIRVYLLMRSVNPIKNYTNAKTYKLGTKTVAAKNDAFFRRVFSTTIQMRNATLPNA